MISKGSWLSDVNKPEAAFVRRLMETHPVGLPAVPGRGRRPRGDGSQWTMLHELRSRLLCIPDTGLLVALVVSSESENDAADVVSLGEIPQGKLLEISHEKSICPFTDGSFRHHHVKTVKSAVEYLELNRNIGPA